MEINRQGSVWTSIKNEEFQEEDVWGSVSKETKDSNSSFIQKRLQTASITIPKSNKTNPNYSQEPKIIQQSSAPVNIPDWSKIYGIASRNYNTSSKINSCPWLAQSDVDKNNVNDYWFAKSSLESDEEEDDEEGNMIPPHEWISRKAARKQICSFSVCEGAGRTLKGRDLSRVRNAVLTKTGFLESKSNP